MLENCSFLRYYTAYSGNSIPTFRDNLSVPSSKPQDGTDRRYENGAITQRIVAIYWSTRWRIWLGALRYKSEGRGFYSRLCH